MFKHRAWQAKHATPVQCFAPGKEVSDPAPGDFVLTHGKSWTSRLIRLGQKIRYWGPDRIYTRWNHAAIFVSDNGDEYGYTTILSIALSLLFVSKFAFGIDGQEICSALVARCLERTGEIFPQDPWHMMPADLAKFFDVKPGDPQAPIGEVPEPHSAVQARSK